jgi:hypothetical protein
VRVLRPSSSICSTMAGSGASSIHTPLWRTRTTRLVSVAGQWAANEARLKAGFGVAVGGGGLVGVGGTGVKVGGMGVAVGVGDGSGVGDGDTVAVAVGWGGVGVGVTDGGTGVSAGKVVGVMGDVGGTGVWVGGGEVAVGDAVASRDGPGDSAVPVPSHALGRVEGVAEGFTIGVVSGTVTRRHAARQLASVPASRRMKVRRETGGIELGSFSETRSFMINPAKERHRWA